MDVIRNVLIISGALPPDEPEKKDLYYPLFLEEKTENARKVYLVAHERLMGQMRVQMKKKNKRGIEETGKKLHRLRKKYRARFAA